MGYHAWIDPERLVLFVLGAAGEAGDTADRERQDRARPRSSPTTSADRCIAFRARASPASCSVRRRARYWIKQIDITREKDRSAHQGRRGQQRSRLRLDARRQDHADVGRHEDHVLDARRRRVDRSLRCALRISSARSRAWPCRRRAMRSLSWWRSRKNRPHPPPPRQARDRDQRHVESSEAASSHGGRNVKRYRPVVGGGNVHRRQLRRLRGRDRTGRCSSSPAPNSD